MGGESGRARRTLSLPSGGTIECVSNHDGSFDIRTSPVAAAGEEETFVHVDGALRADGRMEVIVDRTWRIEVDVALHEEDGMIRVRMWPKKVAGEHAWRLDVVHPLSPLPQDASTSAGGGEGAVRSPMSGKISRVNFSSGDMVQRGDVVVVMEAMKMEHSIKAGSSGVLSELRCQPGEVVVDGAVLFHVASPNNETG
jgi:biotin carboxyl carrier protein